MFSFFGDDDPFGNPFEEMNRMMSSVHSQMGFGFSGNPLMLQDSRSRQRPPTHTRSAMDPFSLMQHNMNSMFGNLNNMQMSSMQSMSPMGSTSFHSSSSFVSYGSGANGQPRVIQKSSSTNIGPNGVRQTTKSLRDSGTGEQKLSVGRHIGERSHVKEKSENLKTGDQEESEEYINLDEDDAEQFNEEFTQRMGQMNNNRYQRRINYNHAGRHQPYSHRPNRNRVPAAAIEYHQQPNHSSSNSNRSGTSRTANEFHVSRHAEE